MRETDPILCPDCGGLFVRGHPRQKFCSVACQRCHHSRRYYWDNLEVSRAKSRERRRVCREAARERTRSREEV